MGDRQSELSFSEAASLAADYTRAQEAAARSHGVSLERMYAMRSALTLLQAGDPGAFRAAVGEVTVAALEGLAQVLAVRSEEETTSPGT